jgi:transposase
MRNENQQAIRELRGAFHDSGLSTAEHDRIHAVLLKKKGYALKQIVDITEKSEDAIQGWITSYHQRGLEGLKTKPRQTSAAAKLTKEQKTNVKKLVAGHKPAEYGYSDDFWSVPMMRKLVKDRYGVEFATVRSYQKLLRFCGFSYQKAEYIDHRKDETAPEEFKVRLRKRLKKGAFSMSW